MVRNEETFQAVCSCGVALSGRRLPAHQVLRCSGCGGDVFVFPQSPWNLVPKRHEPNRSQPPRLTLRDWLLPACAIGLAVAGLLLMYQWLMAPHPDGVKQPALSVTRQTILERQAKAESLFAQSHFRLALEELRPVGQIPNLAPLSESERRNWQQLHRQTALLADLATEPIEDILRHAAGVREPEWLAEFAHRYKGKSLIFQAELRRGRGGAWEIRYPLGLEKARLAVDDLKILQQIPGPGPEQVLLGVRLASVRLEAPGPTWVVRFDPQAGVFMTAPCWPTQDDPDVAKIQARMAQWLDKSP